MDGVAIFEKTLWSDIDMAKKTEKRPNIRYVKTLREVTEEFDILHRTPHPDWKLGIPVEEDGTYDLVMISVWLTCISEDEKMLEDYVPNH